MTRGERSVSGTGLVLICVWASAFTGCGGPARSQLDAGVPAGCEDILRQDRKDAEPGEPAILREIVNAHEEAVLEIDRFLPARPSSASPTASSSKNSRKRKRLLEQRVGQQLRQLAVAHGLPLENVDATYHEWLCGRWGGSPFGGVG